MSYSPYNLELSGVQAKNLFQGKAVQVNASSIGTGSVIHLTKTQIKHLQKAKENGKGARIQFSNSQATYNRQHGGSLWDSLLNTAKSAVLPVATDIAKQQLGNAQLALAGMSGNPIYQDVLSFVGKQGQQGAED